MAKSIDTILLNSVKEQCKENHQKWFVDTCINIGKSKDLYNDLKTAIQQARIKVGKEPFQAPNDFPKVHGWELPLEMWETAEAARILLLLKGLKKQDVESQLEVLNALFESCDERVQAAIIAGLPLLDKKGELVSIAQLALHTENKFVFTALAWGNPYPAKYFSDDQFNALILQLLELGLDIAPVIGAVNRRNKALKEKVLSFVEQKREAQEDIPQSVWLVVAGFNNADDDNLLLDYLKDQDAKHRFYVASALHTLPKLPSIFEPTILKRADTDNEDRVRHKLAEIISKFELQK